LYHTVKDLHRHYLPIIQILLLTSLVSPFKLFKYRVLKREEKLLQNGNPFGQPICCNSLKSVADTLSAQVATDKNGLGNGSIHLALTLTSALTTTSRSKL